VFTTMRKRIAMAALGAALCAPAAASAQDITVRAALNEAPAYEKRYQTLHDRVRDQLGAREAGRNLLVDGYLENDGDVRRATKGELVESTETLKSLLNPPEPAKPADTAPTETTTTEPVTGGAAASSATAQCESGGDYGAVNPAGYYGAYQFDQQTWDAYAPEGYAGQNPASAPPAAQDAAAANVPYDAWPSCP
jgi:hypothetical protein